jgi:hypothetical protein
MKPHRPHPERLVMRLRPVALVAAIPLALSGLAVIAPAASATPPSYTTIDENLGTEAALSTLDEPTSTGLAGPTALLTQFTAETSGQLKSGRMSLYSPDPGTTYTIGVYELDELSVAGATAEASAELAPAIWAGDAVGTATSTSPPVGAVVGTEFPSDAGSVTAGTTYWLYTYAHGHVYWDVRDAPAYYTYSGAGAPESSNWAPKVDLEAGNPIAVTLDPATPDGENGWYTTNPTATYECIEAVTDCPEPVTFDIDGEFDPQDYVTVGESEDFYWTHSVDVDATAPSITGSATEVTPEAPHDGKTSGHLVTWECADDTSGVATCPDPTYVTGLNDDTVAEAEATDNAGNTAVGTVENLVTVVPVVTPPSTETKPKPAPKPEPKAKKKAKKMTLVIKGLPKASKAGAPAFLPGKTTKLTIKIRGKNGEFLKGKPTWLHTVKTTKSGTKGKPKRALDLRKTTNGWVMDYTASWNWSGTFRKFAIVAPNGKRFTQVIYIR